MIDARTGLWRTGNLSARSVEGSDDNGGDEMGNTDVLETVRDAVGRAGAGAVFGEPVSHDGIVVLPVARVSGGGGGGQGEGGPTPGETGSKPDAMGRGNGGGFGVSARPVGAFVIREGAVSWRPAVDVNRVVLGAQVVAVVALLVLRAVLRRHR
jgi:uncharacterized spore protein YtfJ